MVDVLVADHHAVVRSGIKEFLGATNDLHLVGEAGTACELFELLKRVACDVVLLEINLPDMNGLEVLKRIKRERSDLPVLFFSIFSEDDFAIPAINDGASGYLTKDCPPEQILMALRTIATGARYFSPRLTEKLLAGTVNTGRKMPYETLSQKERDLLLLLSEGMATKKIASSMNLSVKTINTYRSRLLKKLGLDSNAGVTRYVIEQKLG